MQVALTEFVALLRVHLTVLRGIEDLPLVASNAVHLAFIASVPILGFLVVIVAVVVVAAVVAVVCLLLLLLL